tara:strand:+ start:25669 stop:26595 length:927 start_codon:yes stop_codon:yes gene_type:complete
VIHLLAPAKINLSLEIIGPLDSNYYEVRTVLQSVSLFDELFFDHLKDMRLNIDNSINFDEEDIVLKAARLLQRKFDVSLGASIRVIKNIPISAGLGGGSSDAATTLLGLNKLWRLNLSDDELHDVASELGSDVPFFINGGTRYGEGRGDELSKLPMPTQNYVVIFSPTEGIRESKTKSMFGLIQDNHFTDGSRTAELIEAINSQKPLSHLLFNVFDAVASLAYSPYVGTKSVLGDLISAPYILTGSGPSLFALFSSEKDMMQVVNQNKLAGYIAYPARLISSWSTQGLDGGSVENIFNESDRSENASN